MSDLNEAANRWYAGLISEYPDFKLIPPEKREEEVRRAVEDMLLEDETLKTLSTGEADQKILTHPRVYQAKVAERIFGKREPLTTTIKNSQKKAGLYSDY